MTKQEKESFDGRIVWDVKNDWDEYIQDCAEDCGVEFDEAKMLFDLLGPSEAYDGFVTTLEDHGNGY